MDKVVQHIKFLIVLKILRKNKEEGLIIFYFLFFF